MRFYMKLIPPTVTAQERRVRMIKGRPIFYDPPKIKQAKALLMANLTAHKPGRPLEGALSLTTVWNFARGKSHKDGEWRITRPDTDNLQKLLKDCMTKAGFWLDDAQVCQEHVEKRWSDEPTGIYIEIKRLKATPKALPPSVIEKS